MKNFFLTKVRLSWYLVILLAVFIGIKFALPEYALQSAALTLFSVNSFLYGFYVAPILSGQKTRIDELHRLVRSEANALFSMLLMVKKIDDAHTRKSLHDLFERYSRSILREKGIAQGEDEYEAIISYCVDYEGPAQAQVEAILSKLVDNQANRTQFNMQFQNSVYSNEWIITLLLFAVTLGFILILSTGNIVALKLLAALLATGLSMLLIILLKMSTLTHKRARNIWHPIEKLLDSKFHRFD